MTNTNELVQYNKNEFEFFVDKITNETFASIRGMARICNVSDTTIRKYIGANQMTLKKAEVLTPGGLQGANLFDEIQIVDVLFKYNLEQAKKFTRLGIRKTIHELVGHKPESEDDISGNSDVDFSHIESIKIKPAWQSQRLDGIPTRKDFTGVCRAIFDATFDPTLPNGRQMLQTNIESEFSQKMMRNTNVLYYNLFGKSSSQFIAEHKCEGGKYSIGRNHMNTKQVMLVHKAEQIVIDLFNLYRGMQKVLSITQMIRMACFLVLMQTKQKNYPNALIHKGIPNLINGVKSRNLEISGKTGMLLKPKD